jgi:hypothetical protein
MTRIFAPNIPLRSPVLSPTMPRDGALTLADVRQPVLTVVCEPADGGTRNCSNQ